MSALTNSCWQDLLEAHHSVLFFCRVLTAFVVACTSLPAALQLSQAHTDHKKLRDQYSAEILARNADLASLEAAEQRAAQLQEQLTGAQDASTQALAAQQRAAEQAAASVAAAAAARSEAEGRCARLQSQLDGMTAQLRQLAEAQAGGFALTAESEYTCCCNGRGCEGA
jgi:hypothetical protein